MRVHIVHFLYSLSFIPTVKDSKWVTATNTVSCQARAGSSIPSGISKTALSNTRWDTRPMCLLFQFNTETPVLLFRLPKSVSQKHKKDHHSDSLLCAKLSLYSHSMGQSKNIWMPVQIIIAACKWDIQSCTGQNQWTALESGPHWGPQIFCDYNQFQQWPSLAENARPR